MMLPKLLPRWLFKMLSSSGLVHRLTDFFRLSQLSIQEVVSGLTDDKELQAVFAYCFGDFGSAPSEGPWTMMALLWNHYRRGAGYPVGGSSQIAHSIIPVIQKTGGKVLVRAPVRGIRVESGRVVGVEVGGKFPTFVPCPRVISDAGLINTFNNLLPPQVALSSRYTKYTREIGSGHAALQLFVGLDGSSKELGYRTFIHASEFRSPFCKAKIDYESPKLAFGELGAHNIWAFTDTDIDGIWQRYVKNTSLQNAIDGNDPVPILFVSFPSAKDPTYESRFPGKSVCTIVSFCHWDWFKQWNGQSPSSSSPSPRPRTRPTSPASRGSPSAPSSPSATGTGSSSGTVSPHPLCLLPLGQGPDLRVPLPGEVRLHHRLILPLGLVQAVERSVPILFVSFPSAKDPTYESRFPGKSVCTIVSFCHWDWFKQWNGTTHKKRGDDYERAKQEFSHQIWERVLKYFPQLKGKDEYMEFGSPLSTQYYIGAPRGEIYGLDHGMRKFTPDAMADLRPKTDIPGLWLTGQDIFICGFAGAAYGGLLCASDLLGQRLIMETGGLKDKRKTHWKSQ